MLTFSQVQTCLGATFFILTWLLFPVVHKCFAVFFSACWGLAGGASGGHARPGRCRRASARSRCAQFAWGCAGCARAAPGGHRVGRGLAEPRTYRDGRAGAGRGLARHAWAVTAAQDRNGARRCLTGARRSRARAAGGACGGRATTLHVRVMLAQVASPCTHT